MDNPLTKSARLLVLLGLGAGVLRPQPVPTQVQTFPDQYVRQDPGRCVEGQTLYNLTEHASKRCDSAGTWVAGGGSSIPTELPIGVSITGGTRYQPLFEDVNAHLAQSSSFVQNATVIAPLAAPSLAKVGVGIGTMWGYKLSCGFLGSLPVALGTEASSEATISGNATLDGAHSISVTVPDLTGTGLTSCDVYRTTAGETPSTTGLIGNVASSGILSDTGLPVVYPFVFAPDDYSVGMGSGLPLVVQSKGSAFGTYAQAASANFNFFQSTANTLGTYSHTAMPGWIDFASDVFFGLIVDDATKSNLSTVWASIDFNTNFSGQSGQLTSTPYVAGIRIASGVTVDRVVGWKNYNNIAGTVGTLYNMDLSPNILNGGTITTQAAGLFLGDWSGISHGFAIYGEGGTIHLETGATGTVGVDIERHAGQTADLFRLLDFDGTTILSRFDKDGIIRAAGYKSSDGTTGVTVSACTLFKEGLCVAGT